MNFFLLLFSIGLVSSIPPDDVISSKKMKTEKPEEKLNQHDSTTPDFSQSSSSVNAPDESESPSCYFSKVRMSESEQKERDSFTKVTTNCGGNLVK